MEEKRANMIKRIPKPRILSLYQMKMAALRERSCNILPLNKYINENIISKIINHNVSTVNSASAPISYTEFQDAQTFFAEGWLSLSKRENRLKIIQMVLKSHFHLGADLLLENDEKY
jgi:hypothetical protein